MERTFRPQKNLIITVTVTWYSLAIFMGAIFIYAGNSIETLIFPFITLFALATFFPALFFFTRIIITSERLSLVLIPPFKKTTKISDITSVAYRSRLVGGIDAYLISYHWKWGIHRTITITANAYGPESIKEILTTLRQKNPSIKFDRETENFLN